MIQIYYIQWKKVESLGAQVTHFGNTYDEAQSYTKQRVKDQALTFVHPFDHPQVIAGQGTIGTEIIRQIPNPESLHAIFVPVSGGGLIAGIAAYIKRVCPHIKIISIDPYEANAMALSLHHDQRIVLKQVGGFADGVAVKVVGEENFRLCRELIDGVILVSSDAICASIKRALSIAEAYCRYYGLKGENVVAITSGANMNFDRLGLMLQLANVGRLRKAILATSVPEKWGTIKQFYELVLPVKITEFRYRYNAYTKESVILYNSELDEMLVRMDSADLKTFNLTDNQAVKDHFEFMVGGGSNTENEIVCQFEFPEKSDTMGKLLDVFSPRWNISMVHYRAQLYSMGESNAIVLVGFQVAAWEVDEFRAVADKLGCNYAFV